MKVFVFLFCSVFGGILGYWIADAVFNTRELQRCYMQDEPTKECQYKIWLFETENGVSSIKIQIGEDYEK